MPRKARQDRDAGNEEEVCLLVVGHQWVCVWLRRLLSTYMTRLSLVPHSFLNKRLGASEFMTLNESKPPTTSIFTVPITQVYFEFG
jgi:hypothetical protein